MKDHHKKQGTDPEPKAHAPHDPAAAAPAPAPAAPADAELAALKDRLLRLQADFDNFRKRTAKERAEFSARAIEDLAQELLPVIDHFDLGLKSAKDHGADPTLIDGLRLVYDQLLAALKKFGVTPIDAEGQAFDPHQHEAVTHAPSEEHPADTVITQTRRGFKLGDRLLRAAQVVVSRGPAAEAPGEAE